jgi:bifunctional non-homologous end joining protein LigD
MPIQTRRERLRSLPNYHRMARAALPKSKRQYVHVNNGPAQRLVRTFKAAKSAPMMDYVEPLLATEAPPPRGTGWVHEIKYDGYRFQLHLQNGQARFFTRRGNDWSNRVRSLIAATASISTYAAIVDGEVVVPLENGATDFGALESELKQSGSDRIAFYAFDLLYLDGYDLRRCTLTDRKEALRLLLEKVSHPILYSEHIDDYDGLIVAKEACRMELEGTVSKRANSPYVSGHSGYWTKKPCRTRDTFVVVGWAEKRGKFDGIYLAKTEGDDLVYAGKLERGFDDKKEKEMMRDLRPLITAKKPMKSSRVRFPKARWVKPQVLVEAEFRGKTGDGLLRHPSYKGIRRDTAEAPKRRRTAIRRTE